VLTPINKPQTHSPERMARMAMEAIRGRKLLHRCP
jgi:hypothetical protein